MAGTTERGAATRERIVATASALFAEQGVNGTGLDQVLRAAAANKSQLYQHFTSKDALVLAVVDWRRTHQSEPMVQALAEVSSRAGLARWLEAYVASGAEVQYAQGCPIGALASELAETHPEARAALSDCFGAWRQALVQVGRRLRDAGELPDDVDLDRLARGQVAVLEGGRLLAQTERDGRSLRAAADAALALLDAPPRR